MKEFNNSLTHETSKVFTYLGIYIEKDDQGIYSVDMEDYQKNMVISHFGSEEKIGSSAILARKNLFELNKMDL